MIKEEYKCSDITERIIGCAMRVHQRMRNGYQESIYHRYDNIPVEKRRVDFLVDGKVIIEIKAASELTDAHLEQALNYLEVMNLEVGLLINFGSKSLEVKRLINNKYIPIPQSDQSM